MIEPSKIVLLQGSSNMTAMNARAATILKSHNNLASWLFAFCTLVMFASVIRMWRHWFDISSVLGFDRTLVILTAVTGSALIVSWWVNTANE
jgi:hypothetical protein